MDFDVEIKQHLNMLLEEFGQYKKQNRCDRENLAQISTQTTHYFEGLKQDLSNALSGFDSEDKTRGMNLINESTELLNNHLKKQQWRLENEFEQTKQEYQNRARSLR